jgi:hypothetical protein
MHDRLHWLLDNWTHIDWYTRLWNLFFRFKSLRAPLVPDSAVLLLAKAEVSNWNLPTTWLWRSVYSSGLSLKLLCNDNFCSHAYYPVDADWFEAILFLNNLFWFRQHDLDLTANSRINKASTLFLLHEHMVILLLHDLPWIRNKGHLWVKLVYTRQKNLVREFSLSVLDYKFQKFNWWYLATDNSSLEID